MKDYRSRLVSGWIGGQDDENEEKVNITQCGVRIRVTSDEYGKSLSLTAEDNNVMIQIGIPLEPVNDIIRIYNDRGGGHGKK